MIATLKEYLQNREADKVISFLLNNPTVLDQMDENGVSGFMHIAYHQMDLALIKAQELKESYTFHEAIVSGRKDKVHSFIAESKDIINRYSADGFTPIALAAFFNQTAIATLLLNEGADPSIQANNPAKVNALHAAVVRDNVELCRLFIAKGIDVNIPQAQKITALHSAAHRGNLELVKLLVENGADTSLTTENGDTALSFAQKDGYDAVCDYLKEVG